MVHVAAKATGNKQIMVCERGASFDYNNLVSDMRSLAEMRNTECPVVFDATHSVQLPGGQGTCSRIGKSSHYCWYCKLVYGTDPKPKEAISDGSNLWPSHRMKELLETLVTKDQVVKANSLRETNR